MTPTEALTGPLSHLRVIEVGRTLAAALCAKFFADLGAQVVKIEPRGGDALRRYGPFPGDRPDPEMSGLFLHANTSKLGVTLDLEDEKGRGLLAELAGQADILVEDWPASDPLPIERPTHLIQVSITPFGHRGPYAGYQATDLIAFHASGAGHRYDGMPDREPLRAPCHQSHQWGAIAGATGAMTAYLARALTGRGQRVEVSEAEVIAQMLVAYGQVSVYFDTGRTETRTGWRATQGGPNGMLPCKDGFIAITALEPAQWDHLVEAMGSPEWAQTELFRGASWDRHPYITEIYALMAEWLAEHTKDEVYQACQARRVPCTPVLTTAEVLASAHLAARNYFAQSDSAAGRVRLPGAPYQFARTPWRIARPAPRLGEHNEHVLTTWLGYGPEDVGQWREELVI